MKKILKADISKKLYKDSFVDRPSEIEVGKIYRRKFINEKGKELIREYYVTEILELNDGGLIIKSIVT